MQPEVIPTFMMVEASSVCNYRCPLCLWTHNDRHGFLTLETFRRFIADARHGLRRACFSGRGEPTLNDEIYGILAETVEAGVIADLATNGSTLLDNVDRILDSGVDNVNVSIDADNAAEYVAYRVHGDFEAVVAGMRKLADEKARRNLRRPNLQTCTVLLRHNETRREELTAFFRSLGFERFLFKSPHLGHGQLAEPIEELADRWLPRDQGLVRVRHRSRPSEPITCGFRDKAQLLWNGDVTRCAVDQNAAVIGNVREASFQDIWNGELSRAIGATIAAGNFASCRTCEYSGRAVAERDDERYVV